MSTYLCAYDGCYYPTAAFGWCTGHYTQATTSGALAPLVTGIQLAAPAPAPAHPPAPISTETLAQALDLELPEEPGKAPEDEVEAVDAVRVDAAGTSRPRMVRRYYPSFAAAFQDQVRPGEGCWGWDGATGSNGLPILRVDGASLAATRYVYEFVYGPIPEGRRLRNRKQCPGPCVNPAHYGHKAT